eukprot:728913-Rhodomonas_salina.1
MHAYQKLTTTACTATDCSSSSMPLSQQETALPAPRQQHHKNKKHRSDEARDKSEDAAWLEEWDKVWQDIYDWATDTGRYTTARVERRRAKKMKHDLMLASID